MSISLEQLTIELLKTAAKLNCIYCQGFYPDYGKEPFFQRGQDVFVHGGKTGSMSSIECKSDQLWEYINAWEKSTQQEVG